MESSRLWQLINSLSIKQLKSCQKGIQSPFFNQNKSVVALFDFLYSCKTELRLVPSKAQAHRNLFPGKPFQDKRIRNIMSLLLKAVEQILSVQYYLEEDTMARLGTAKVFRELKLDRHYEHLMKQIEQQQKEQAFHNADYYLEHVFFQEERYRWLSNKKRNAELNLQEVSDNLDIAFVARKLRQACFSLSHQTVYTKDYDYGLLRGLLHLLEDSHYLEVPAVVLYYYCYRALSGERKEKDFRKFKALLVKHSSLFPIREIRDLYLLATNYCIKRINEGDQHFAQEGLEIYQEGLDKGILLVNGELSRFTYRNIVAKGLVCQQYDWTEKFLFQYKSKLNPIYQISVFSFNLARLRYEQAQYDEALVLLQEANYKDLLLNLSAKTLAAKIYFKIEAIDLLYAHLEAMRNFIRRQKKIGYHQDNYLNFVALLRKIMDRPAFAQDVKTELRNEIKQTKALAERKWLLEQLS